MCLVEMGFFCISDFHTFPAFHTYTLITENDYMEGSHTAKALFFAFQREEFSESVSSSHLIKLSMLLVHSVLLQARKAVLSSLPVLSSFRTVVTVFLLQARCGT